MSLHETSTWYSHRVKREVRLSRWGHFGVPVLVFPTAGGDSEEIERWQMIRALAPLLGAGRAAPRKERGLGVGRRGARARAHPEQSVSHQGCADSWKFLHA